MNDAIIKTIVARKLTKLLAVYMMSEAINGLISNFSRCEVAFGSKRLKVNHWKTKVTVNGDITIKGFYVDKANTCGICGLKEKTNSAIHMQCSKCIHRRKNVLE